MMSTKISDFDPHLSALALHPPVVSAKTLGLKSLVGGQVKPKHELFVRIYVILALPSSFTWFVDLFFNVPVDTDMRDSNRIDTLGRTSFLLAECSFAEEASCADK